VIPGWRELKIESVYINDDNTQVVITGIPMDEGTGEEITHNCDAMGCGSCSHVTIRAKVTKYGYPKEATP
jgi:hypothetical protein